jgi:phosphopantothenoylcysteine decarboxylase/phosphopantothenate--cysteine ligase
MCERLLVGVSGSIHAVHTYAYLALFRESFAGRIKVVMTPNAARMVDPRTVELLADDRVFVDSWDHSSEVDRAAHIQLGRWADWFVIVPASANTIGKAAHGIADTLLSTVVCSYTKPIVFAPAMNPDMWQNHAVQRNVAALRADGHHVIEPEDALSVTSGEWDKGLTPTPELVTSNLKHLVMKQMRNEYWTEATSEPPLTPAQKKVQEMRTVTPKV